MASDEVYIAQADVTRFAIAEVMTEGLAEVDPLWWFVDAEERAMGLDDRLASISAYWRRLGIVTDAARASIVGGQ